MSINASAPIFAGNSAINTKKTNPLLEIGKGKSEDHFSFWDVLDVVNPLQHIPIVSNIYRSITGDQINNAARIAGDTLYGGVVGLGFGVANAIAVHTQGDDIGGVAMAKMGLLKSQEEAQTKVETNKNTSDAVDLKNIPMVEVHPMQKEEAKDEIIWDKPQQIAETAPAAMPSAKELNDIEPVSGLPAAPVNKAEIPQDMMSALDKYQAMKTSAPEETGMIKPKNIFATPAGAPVNMAQNNVQSSAPTVKKPTAAFNKLRHF